MATCFADRPYSTGGLADSHIQPVFKPNQPLQKNGVTMTGGCICEFQITGGYEKLTSLAKEWQSKTLY